MNRTPCLHSLVLFLLATIAVAEEPERLPCPAMPGSAEPNLMMGADGKLYLSWIASKKPTATLRFSTWTRSAWGAPQTIATGDDWFVNWADFPSLAVLPSGTLAAHWLQKSSAGKYSYDVMISVSRDAGKTWSKPASPHKDGTPSEHGFASLVPAGDHFGVFWLDGRAMKKPGDNMSLRFTTLSDDGQFGKELLIDDRVCECCQTSAVLLPDGGFLVTYRDRSTEEVRDIGAAIVRDGAVQKRFHLNADGWTIKGCPVNGPAIATRGNTIAAAWPTQGEDGFSVRVRSSPDVGQTWGKVVEVNTGETIGRVDIAMLNASQAIVSWIESGDKTTIRCRLVNADGTMGPPRQIAATSSARSSGFPRIAVLGQQDYAAWAQDGDPSHIQTARLPLAWLLKPSK